MTNVFFFRLFTGITKHKVQTNKQRVMDVMNVSWILWYFLILLCSDLWPYHLVQALKCNYCFNADEKRDCMYSTQDCVFGQVCAIDTIELTYTIGAKRDTEKTVKQYKMGCAATITCKDDVTYGPGPYGYSKIYRKCCCSDLCIRPDGVGRGMYEHCPNAFDNQTSAVAPLRTSFTFQESYFGALLSGLYYILCTWLVIRFSLTCLEINQFDIRTYSHSVYFVTLHSFVLLHTNMIR